jgi:peptidase M42 family hydrolase
MKANATEFTIDADYLKEQIARLMEIPCPTGFTDAAVVYVCKQLDELSIDYHLTRRGSINATLTGKQTAPDRAIVTHLDTIGAMVRQIKSNGRLAITPIGHWSSRFAEGGRVTIFTDNSHLRGSVLPIMAAGHVYNEAVDTQPVNWDQVEVRVDAPIKNIQDAYDAGLHVGDTVAFDPNPEFLDNGFIVSRHLDNKAGTASLLTALKAVRDYKLPLTLDCHPIFTLSEEVGSGVGHVLDKNITEFVGIDIGPVAEGQNANISGVTIAMKDSSGPFDYHLTRHLIKLADQWNINHTRDVFRFYYSDAVSAVQAGHDMRHALVTFGTDATHGYERTHISALTAVAELLVRYMQSEPAIQSDAADKTPVAEFSKHAEFQVGSER